ncbi:MAG: helix-turn-helix domain-containing protein [bacterium]
MEEYIGARIAGIRNQKGFSQQELANRTNINIRTIQRIESGEVKPRLYTLRILSEYLGYNFLNEKTSADDASRGWLIALHLSNLFPIFIVAFGIWAFKKNDSKKIERDGIVIMNYQILLIVLWIISFLLFIVLPYLHLNISFGTMGQFEMLIIFNVLAYLLIFILNIVLIILNTIRISTEGKNAFYPHIRIIR